MTARPRPRRRFPAGGSPKAALADRPLLRRAQSAQLGRLFKTLSHPARLRLLHALAREGQLCVTDLARAVGMKPQAVCNQLRRLVDRGILDSTRDGSQVLYRIVDPCVPKLLEYGLCLEEDACERRP